MQREEDVEWCSWRDRRMCVWGRIDGLPELRRNSVDTRSFQSGCSSRQLHRWWLCKTPEESHRWRSMMGESLHYEELDNWGKN